MSSVTDPAVDSGSVPGESVFVETNGIRLHTIQAGPSDGPLVILLHGFPEFWYGWHSQITPLAEAGYRVIVPDQRGYNRSDKPAGVASYHLDELACDIVGLIDAADCETAAVVGHDWGAAVAWWLALHYPERLSSLTAVNVPHPTVMEETLRTSWTQRRNSWYMLGFQVPLLPEAASSFRNYWLLKRTLETSSRPGTFSQQDYHRYQTAWSRPGALTAMVNWYRAVGRYRPRPVRTQVSVPTLVLWGEQDEFLVSSMAHESVDRCERGRLVVVPEATHWIVHEESRRVTTELVSHLEETRE